MEITAGNIFLSLIVILITFLSLKFLKWIIKVLQFKNKITKKSGYIEPDLHCRFSKSKIPENIDYIIIGSGTSGLICASALSKIGKKVLVLEQHDRLGGCYHTFTEQGFEFDTGFHYVGNSKVIRWVQQNLGGKDIEWNSYDHYDTIQLDQDKYILTGPAKKFYEQLKKQFPENEKQIEDFKRLGKRVYKMQGILAMSNFLPMWIKYLVRSILKIKYSDIYQKSVNQVMNQIGLDKYPKLKLVLGGNLLDIGSNMDETPFCMLASLQSHYFVNGSMYPKNGTNDIIKSYAGAILANGGTLLTKAKVESIIVEKGKVQGVQLKGNVQILAKKVISTMGIPNTIQALPDQYKFKNNYKYDNAFNCINIFLGLNTEGMDRSELPTHNTWYYPPQKGADGKNDWNFEFMQKNSLKNQNKETRGLFITFPSVKGDIQKDKHSCCIISETKWEFFDKFRINEVRREQGYKEMKKEILDQVISRFLEIYPQFKDKIVYSDLGTPLTNETYYGRKTPYGVQFNQEKFYSDEFMKASTPVKDLYLSGQDIIFPGIIGGLMTGLLSTVQAENIL